MTLFLFNNLHRILKYHNNIIIYFIEFIMERYFDLMLV
jgi:hypothetical protein